MLSALKPFIRTFLVLLLLSLVIPAITYTNWMSLILASLVFVILQSFIKPVLKILLLPITIITFGFFSTVISVGLLWLVTYLVPGFHIAPIILLGVPLHEFFTFVFVSFLISLVSGLVEWVI